MFILGVMNAVLQHSESAQEKLSNDTFELFVRDFLICWIIFDSNIYFVNELQCFFMEIFILIKILLCLIKMLNNIDCLSK